MRFILTTCAVVFLVAFSPLCGLGATSPPLVSDLSSPSQETRDAAAKLLRETYSPPPRTNWDSLISSLKLGAPETNVMAQLGALKFESEGEIASGNTETRFFRLDNLWVLECSFTNSGPAGRLARRDLTERLRNIWVEPPRDFTGTWTAYYANGQPSHRIPYQNGHQDGEVILFRADGTKSVVSHLTNGLTAGEEEGFYPSGKRAYKGQYKGGIQVGTWIWYNEDGSIKSRKEFSKPRDRN